MPKRVRKIRVEDDKSCDDNGVRTLEKDAPGGDEDHFLDSTVRERERTHVHRPPASSRTHKHQVLLAR